MLKGNLATRPFFNERQVNMALAAVALCAALFTAWNGWKIVTLSSARGQYRARIARDEAEAGRIRAQALTLQQSIDRAALAKLAASTREANDIIDQRTFSWTVFFGLIEKTLPLDVRVVSVTPHVEKGVFKVTMTVVARNLDDLDVFTDALLGTGAFYDIVPADVQAKEDATFTASMQASYFPPASPAPPAAAPPAVPAAAPAAQPAPAAGPARGGR